MKIRTMERNEEFKLSGIDSHFENRSKDLFSCLSSIEKSHQKYLSRPNNDSHIFMKPDPEDENIKKDLPDSMDNDFKIPQPLVSKNIIRDSKKWTKYSLSDVSLDQMSESSNYKALSNLMFLNENKKDCINEESKHVFKKPKQISKNSIFKFEKNINNSSQPETNKNNLEIQNYSEGKKSRKRNNISCETYTIVDFKDNDHLENILSSDNSESIRKKQKVTFLNQPKKSVKMSLRYKDIDNDDDNTHYFEEGENNEIEDIAKKNSSVNKFVNINICANDLYDDFGELNASPSDQLSDDLENDLTSFLDETY